MITLLYKSFKSELANLQPSIWIIGLKSGGIIGKASKINHSGLCPDLSKFEASFIFWRIFFCLIWVEDLSSFSWSFINSSKSILSSNFLKCSAQVPHLKTCENLESKTLYSSSQITFQTFKDFNPFLNSSNSVVKSSSFDISKASWYLNSASFNSQESFFIFNSFNSLWIFFCISAFETLYFSSSSFQASISWSS